MTTKSELLNMAFDSSISMSQFMQEVKQHLVKVQQMNNFIVTRHQFANSHTYLASVAGEYYWSQHNDDEYIVRFSSSAEAFKILNELSNLKQWSLRQVSVVQLQLNVKKN